MSYYQFNRPKILQKAKLRYSKGKSAEYYLRKQQQKSNKGKVKESIQKLV